MNPNTPGDAPRLATELAAQFRGVPRALATKVSQLADGGLAPFEIAAQTGLPIQMITLILRGAAPGIPK